MVIVGEYSAPNRRTEEYSSASTTIVAAVAYDIPYLYLIQCDVAGVFIEQRRKTYGAQDRERAI